jgi:hypothetical protein
MNPTITCKFCASTDVADDLECIRMCERRVTRTRFRRAAVGRSHAQTRAR